MVTRIPRVFSASRVAPRAMNVTSSPACANCPPTKPPIAPAPMMAIFIRVHPRHLALALARLTSYRGIADGAPVDLHAVHHLCHARYLIGILNRGRHLFRRPDVAVE